LLTLPDSTNAHILLSYLYLAVVGIPVDVTNGLSANAQYTNVTPFAPCEFPVIDLKPLLTKSQFAKVSSACG
jgi:hypothetical protein